MSVAYYMVLDADEPGFDTFVNGKAVAHATDELDALCHQNGLQTLDSFMGQSMDEFSDMLGEDVELPEGEDGDAGGGDRKWFVPRPSRPSGIWHWIFNLMGTRMNTTLASTRCLNALRTFITSTLGLLAAACAFAAPNCTKLDREVKPLETVIPGCKAVHEVVGNGRLHFYSAPDQSCKMPGTFVVPGQTVIAYSEYKDYTSVMYINQKTNDSVVGWVPSARLKSTGTGIAPCQ